MAITANDDNKSTSMRKKVTLTIAAATGLSSGAMADEATTNEQPADQSGQATQQTPHEVEQYHADVMRS